MHDLVLATSAQTTISQPSPEQAQCSHAETLWADPEDAEAAVSDPERLPDMEDLDEQLALDACIPQNKIDAWDSLPAHVDTRVAGPPTQPQQSSACSAEEQEQAMGMMRKVVEELQDPGLLDKAIPEDEIATEVAKLEALLPDKAAFQAGKLGKRRAVWSEYLRCRVRRPGLSGPGRR